MQVSKSLAFIDSLKQADILGVMEQIAGSMLVEAYTLAVQRTASAGSSEPCKT